VFARLRRFGPAARAAAVAASRLAGVRRSLDSVAIALTFDDGPDPERTPALLDRLHDLGIVATFFVVGRRAQMSPDVVRRAVEAGHAVGSHSWSHPEPWTLGTTALRREYRDGRHAVEDLLGRRVRLFRPPKGFVDVKGALAMRAAGVRPWLWTIDPGDWRPGITSRAIAEALAPVERGSVVLLHDTLVDPIEPACLDRRATLDVLEVLSSYARERGLTFATLPE
jgi:peptidoglycan/xylan/chitin deacetylase (PgdA/CDA1 family)